MTAPWTWDGLTAGAHAVVWNGRSDAGELARVLAHDLMSMGGPIFETREYLGEARMVNEDLQKEVRTLRDWKESALKAYADLNLQEIGAYLGLPIRELKRLRETNKKLSQQLARIQEFVLQHGHSEDRLLLSRERLLELLE